MTLFISASAIGAYTRALLSRVSLYEHAFVCESYEQGALRHLFGTRVRRWQH
jgi:hypothetical protein